MVRYAITSRALYPGDEGQKQAALLQEAARWIADGVEIIQLREKDLPAGALASLARKLLKNINLTGNSTRLLISGRPDIAVATGAHGVHLTSQTGELTPVQIRTLYASASLPQPFITVSCHTPEDVGRAKLSHANAVLFAPVFEKSLPGLTIPGHGLDQLRTICVAALPIPVYALGGVTLENAAACLEAGASGIAGIRLFHV